MSFTRFFHTLLLFSVPAIAAWLWFSRYSGNYHQPVFFLAGVIRIFGDDKEFFWVTRRISKVRSGFSMFCSLIERNANTTLSSAPIGFDVGFNTGLWADAALAYPYVHGLESRGFTISMLLSPMVQRCVVNNFFRQTNTSLPVALGWLVFVYVMSLLMSCYMVDLLNPLVVSFFLSTVYFKTYPTERQHTFRWSVLVE